MSDLDRRLADLAHQATRRASPPPASRITSLAERRRQRRRRALVTVPVVAMVLAAAGVGLARLHGGASSSSASVSVGVPPSSAGPARADGGGGGGGPSPAATVRPAVLGVSTAAGGVRTCAVEKAPVVTGASTLRPRLPAHPLGVTAVWIPALASSGCRSTVTTGSQQAAAALVAAARSAPALPERCPATAGGNVELAVVDEAGGEIAVLHVHLGGCDPVTLPDGAVREGSSVVAGLGALDPPGWARAAIGG